jgi:hypothetical protein
VTENELLTLLEQYRAGLEAEVALLKQLESVAGRQRDVSESRDYDGLRRENDDRDQLTRKLVTIDQGLVGVREVLSRSRRALAGHRAYATVVELRRTAADMVAKILATDRDSMKALADADLARKAAIASLERGETTLAAYRKVIAPPVSSASLVNRRG